MRGYLTPPDVAARLGDDMHRVVGVDLVRVSLFGSRARQDANPASDFDVVVVVTHTSQAIKDAIYGLAGDYLAEHRVSLSPKVISKESFKHLRATELPFWRRFKEDEVVLWPRAS